MSANAGQECEVAKSQGSCGARDTESRYHGLPISEGVAIGGVCLFNERRHSNLSIYRVDGKGKKREKERLENAIAAVLERIGALIQETAKRIGPAEAEIFRAQSFILQDPGITGRMIELIDTAGVNAESAVARTLDDYETRIQAIDNEYLKERATDIGEIQRRLLDTLRNMSPSFQCAGEEHCQRGHNRIVIAGELTPRLTVELDSKHTLAFVTERGGPSSHAAILARALGIPAVSGIKNVHRLISCGTEVLVDGHKGHVVVWPSAETLEQYSTLSHGVARPDAPVEPVRDLEVMANISLAVDVHDALESMAEGIGLYRTEFEFIAAGRVLCEDEQFDRYLSVFEAMRGRPVTFRLLDVGGDKPVPFLNLPQEPNPCLGLRGSRLLLARPDLLRPQVRALARVSSQGPVNLLYPMIVDRDQFLALKKSLLENISDLPAENLRHGVLKYHRHVCKRVSSWRWQTLAVSAPTT